MYLEVEERVDTLENLVGQFIVQTNMMLGRLERDTRDLKNEMREFKEEMREFKNEMREFKNEMGEFKDEMSEFKDEMSEFKDEMSEFKDEMLGFKDEMSAFKEESRRDRKAMNKQWGDLANKMGTIVEDIIAPGVRPMAKEFFHCDIQDFAIHVKRKRKDLNLEGEFDVLAVSETNLVFVIEVKSTPRKEYFFEFLENLEKFKQLFPEYAEHTLIPIFASLRFEPEMIALATQHNVYVMAYREWEFLDLLNFEDLQRHSANQE